MLCIQFYQRRRLAKEGLVNLTGYRRSAQTLCSDAVLRLCAQTLCSDAVLRRCAQTLCSDACVISISTENEGLPSFELFVHHSINAKICIASLQGATGVDLSKILGDIANKKYGGKGWQ